MQMRKLCIEGNSMTFVTTTRMMDRKPNEHGYKQSQVRSSSEGKRGPLGSFRTLIFFVSLNNFF